jgi:glycosyltransferase involved in cell wall biosynthesis
MRISVAMCTYNGARFLREQLASIAAQSLLPDELVVCDDCSSDETPEIIGGFAQSAAFAVRLEVNERNLGPAKNFERAIMLCEGDLIALSDQDDYWYPEKLSRLFRVMEADEALGGVFSDAQLMNENSERSPSHLWDRIGYRPPEGSMHVEESLARRLLKGFVVTGATMMIRKQVRELLIPAPEGWMHDAWIAWMLALYSGIAAVDEPLIAYRIHGAQHLGLAPRSLATRIENARHSEREQRILIARLFKELRAHWVEHPGNQFEVRRTEMEEKIDFLNFQLNLPGSFLKRLYRVASAYDRYRLYANGSKTMWKDVLFH